MQLLWLMIVILAVILVFQAIVAFFFRDGSLQWQDLLALFLDPGCFGGAGEHDVFRLIATLFGMFLFSALLISVVGNIFENISDSFKNGNSRYRYWNHVLILGGGRQLMSMLNALVQKDCIYTGKQIVVMTTQDVDTLRKKIFSHFGIIEGKRLQKRLTLYYGSRENENDLDKKDMARNASAIYIIGEDNEIDHDSKSLRCLEMIRGLCGKAGKIKDIRCFLVLDNSSSIDVYKFVSAAQSGAGTVLDVDVIDANEYIAEQVLVADHGGDVEVTYPVIDYHLENGMDGSSERIDGITEDDCCHVHFVIAGTTAMARAMAMTTANICHFPNFKDGRHRTVISFVEHGIKDKMDKFTNDFADLFRLSHYRYGRFDESGELNLTEYFPDPAYGDFLDIEWEFIDARLESPGMRSLLTSWACDPLQSLSIAICLDSQEDNTSAAIHLPRAVYDRNIPVFVYQQDYDDILDLAKSTGHFGNLHTFGVTSKVEAQDDPLFVYRSEHGKNVNYIYYKEYGEKGKFGSISEVEEKDRAWYAIPEAHKFSSIYCANAMHIRKRSFRLNDKCDVSPLTSHQKSLLYEVEHRRWVMSELLLGYSPVAKAKRDAWKSRRENPDRLVADEAKKEYRELKKNFIHLDITPYDELIPEEQKKDEVIIRNISKILGKGN